MPLDEFIIFFFYSSIYFKRCTLKLYFLLVDEEGLNSGVIDRHILLKNSPNQRLSMKNYTVICNFAKL